jgi:hypothetical protein
MDMIKTILAAIAGAFDNLRAGRIEREVPYCYVQTISVGSSATVDITTVQITDADFELHEVCGVHSDEAATDVSPNFFSLKLATSAGGGRDLMQAAVPQKLLSRQFNRFGRKVVFPKGTTITGQLTNLIAASDTVTLVFRGVRRF